MPVTATQQGVDKRARAFELASNAARGGIVVSTLQCIDPRTAVYRRAGNTTRQIDFAINQLFRGNVVICLDHMDEGTNDKANQWLFDGVLRRLQYEHPGVINGGLVINNLYGFLYIKT